MTVENDSITSRVDSLESRVSALEKAPAALAVLDELGSKVTAIEDVLKHHGLHGPAETSDRELADAQAEQKAATDEAENKRLADLEEKK